MIRLRAAVLLSAAAASFAALPLGGQAQDDSGQTTATQERQGYKHEQESPGAHGTTFGGAGEATIAAEAKAKNELAVGKTSDMVLTLTTKKDKKPVPVTDLEVVHTEPVHLLIVDPSLSDYHHIHPKPTTPGDYEFQFTPKKAGTYNIYVDLHPKATEIQEYSLATIEVPGTPEPVKKEYNREFTVDGYKFEFSMENPDLVQSKPTGAAVKVTGPDGKPFDKLEPVMGAFAHMVGFSENRMNVAHIHPLGKEPTTKEERGGPELKFHLSLHEPGYHVLYSQVQINGKDVFAPFGVQVAERKLPDDAPGLMKEVDAELERLQNVAMFGPLHRVHNMAFGIRDMVQELPSRLKDLDAEKKEKLETSIKRVGTLAGLLDKYGDAGDAEQTKAVMPRFTKEIEAIHEIAGTTPTKSADENVTIVGNKKCPISGMAVGSMEPGSAHIYNGNKVGLCCNGCIPSFMQDAEANLKKAQEDAKQ